MFLNRDFMPEWLMVSFFTKVLRETPPPSISNKQCSWHMVLVSSCFPLDKVLLNQKLHITDSFQSTQRLKCSLVLVIFLLFYVIIQVRELLTWLKYLKPLHPFIFNAVFIAFVWCWTVAFLWFFQYASVLQCWRMECWHTTCRNRRVSTMSSCTAAHFKHVVIYILRAAFQSVSVNHRFCIVRVHP